MLTLITDRLPETATYRLRSFVYVSNGSGYAVHPETGEFVPALGSLTIRLRKGKTDRAKDEIDTYAVAEVDPEAVGTRLFLLLNMTDPAQKELYRVTLGGRNLCKCTAGNCRVVSIIGHGCKHRDALERVIELGGLDPADSQLEYAPPPERPWVYTGFRLPKREAAAALAG